MSQDKLDLLLKFIQRFGITTYPNHPDNRITHQGCLDLENQGRIYRFVETSDHIVWMVKEQQPKPGPSETKQEA